QVELLQDLYKQKINFENSSQSIEEQINQAIKNNQLDSIILVDTRQYLTLIISQL
ncbi:21814_t:CDS:1, partial [Racocetra persica]